jgi:transcriptional regulator with XRE-family HTH domain
VPIDPLSEEAAREFGRRLAACRRRRKLTQERLGDGVGLSREYISRLERGLSNDTRKSPANPTMTLLLALSRELEVELRLDQARNGDVIIEFVDPDEPD